MTLKETIIKYQPINEQEEKEKQVIVEYMNTFSNLLVRENEFAHFTASSWIVNKDWTKVLMVYHNIYQSWAWTGGHADGCEDLLHVAIKEAKEETGITKIEPVTEELFSLEILGVNGHVKRGAFVASHLHLNLTYLLIADEEEKVHVKEDENSGVMWIPIEEAVMKSREPYMQQIYAKLNQKLKEEYHRHTK